MIFCKKNQKNEKKVLTYYFFIYINAFVPTNGPIV